MISYEDFYKFVKKQHIGQKDKLGNSYINHVVWVAENCTSVKSKYVGLGHDLLEDTTTTIKDLQNMKLHDDIIEAIDILTRKKEDTYFEYIYKVSLNELSSEIKLIDISHNLSDERSLGLTDSLRKRYLKALKILKKDNP